MKPWPENKPSHVYCPYCNSNNTELFSLFGQQLLAVQYYCQTCHTPFEYIKDDEIIGKGDVAHLATQAVSEQRHEGKETTR